MKTITTIFFTLGLLLASLLSHAQSKSYKIYDTFSNKEGVYNFSFTKSMIDAIDIDLDEDCGAKNVTGDLHEVRFLSYNPEKGKLSGREFTKKAIAMLPSGYRKYVGEDKDLSDTEIWLLGKKKKYTECHVFVKNDDPGENCFLVSFYGDFTVNDIHKLSQKGKNIADE